MRRLIKKIVAYLSQYTYPTDEELVLSLVLHTANLELPKHKSRLFAPIKGTCGPITLTGNSLPVFEYKVFEKQIMEFIHVRVEVARPDQIRYVATIDSTTAPERHGEIVETRDKYQAPFKLLAHHLYHYFPLTKEDAPHALVI